MANYEVLKERRHPEYELNEDFYTLLNASYKGGRTFLDRAGDYLVQHRLEDSTDYASRTEHAYYLNYCKRVVETYTNYIFKESITRSDDPELTLFFKNADGKGGDLNGIMRKLSSLSSVYGFMDVIVDAPTKDQEKITRRDVKEGKLLPYVILRNPLEAIDWSFDDIGNFNWALYRYVFYEDTDPEVERDEDNIYRYKLITRENWDNFNDEGGLETGTNELKEVFVHRCYHRTDGGITGTSLIGDIAYLNKEIFNWCSMMSEQIARQTFSQLVIPDSGDFYNSTIGENTSNLEGSATDAEKFITKIGTSWAFTFPANSGQPPSYISPDSEQVSVIWTMIEGHISEIYRMAGLTSSDSEDGASGRAKQRQFLSIEAALKAKAKALEQAENEVIRFACLRLGKEFTEELKTTYPVNFDVLSMIEAFEADFKMITAGVSTTLNKYLLQRRAASCLSEASSKIKNDVKKEIEASDGSVLVQLSQSFARVSAETGTEADIGTAGGIAPGEETPSQTAKSSEVAEGATTSQVRRAADVDNKGSQAGGGTDVE